MGELVALHLFLTRQLRVLHLHEVPPASLRLRLSFELQSLVIPALAAPFRRDSTLHFQWSYRPLIIWTRPGRHRPCLLKPAGSRNSTSMTNVPLSSTIGTFSPVASFRMYDPSPDLLNTTVLPLSRIRLTDASGLLTPVTWNVMELTASEPFLLNRTLFSPFFPPFAAT